MKENSEKIAFKEWVGLVRLPISISGVFLLFLIGFGVWVYGHTPNVSYIATHFGVNGKPNGHMPKLLGLFFGVGVATLITALFMVLPLIDPRGRNYRNSLKAIKAVWIGVVLVMTAAQIAVDARALNESFPVIRLVVGFFGLLYIIIGNYLPKIRSNWFVGIRTPWTLSNEFVWYKTHRLGSIMFVSLGVIILVAAFVAPTVYSSYASAIGLLLVVVVVAVYSYMVWRKITTHV